MRRAWFQEMILRFAQNDRGRSVGNDGRIPLSEFRIPDFTSPRVVALTTYHKALNSPADAARGTT
jgi:hypothetical protein